MDKIIQNLRNDLKKPSKINQEDGKIHKNKTNNNIEYFNR